MTRINMPLSDSYDFYVLKLFKSIGVTQLNFNYLNLLDVEKYYNKFIFIKISWLNFNCVTPTLIKAKMRLPIRATHIRRD